MYEENGSSNKHRTRSATQGHAEISESQYQADPALKEGYLKEKHRYFHLRDTAGQERDFHYHEFDKIVILLSGHVDYAVENSVYTLHPWEILLIRHHSIHKAVIDKSVPYERIILYLNEEHYSGVMPEAGLTKCFETADSSLHRLLVPDTERIREVQDVLNRYERYMALSGSEAAAMRETFILQLLILLDSVTLKDSAGSRAVPSKKYDDKDDKIEKAVSYINTHLTAELTVEEIAGTVFLSRTHFMRLFREATGTTVHAYVRQCRLLNAARLIREGESATEAARRSGFEDYTVFYRAFRGSFGVTPAEFKK